MSESIGLDLSGSLKKSSVDQLITKVISFKSQILLAKQCSCVLLSTSIFQVKEREREVKKKNSKRRKFNFFKHPQPTTTKINCTKGITIKELIKLKQKVKEGKGRYNVERKSHVEQYVELTLSGSN